MSHIHKTDISFVTQTVKLITVTTPSVCVWGTHLIQIVVSLSFLQVQRALIVRRKTCQHLVEDVVVSLRFGLWMHTHTHRDKLAHRQT